MMYPILCKVKYETLHRVFAHRHIWVQIGFSVIMNWIVAPLLMASYSSCALVEIALLTSKAYSLVWRGHFSPTNLVCGKG